MSIKYTGFLNREVAVRENTHAEIGKNWKISLQRFRPQAHAFVLNHSVWMRRIFSIRACASFFRQSFRTEFSCSQHRLHNVRHLRDKAYYIRLASQGLARIIKNGKRALILGAINLPISC